MNRAAASRHQELRHAAQRGEWRVMAPLLYTALEQSDWAWLDYPSWRSYLASIPISQGHASKLVQIAMADLQDQPSLCINQAYDEARHQRLSRAV